MAREAFPSTQDALDNGSQAIDRGRAAQARYPTGDAFSEFHRTILLNRYALARISHGADPSVSSSLSDVGLVYTTTSRWT
jgi:hypothetical protein